MRLLLLLFFPFPLSLFAQSTLDECKKDNSYLFDQLRTASGRINNQAAKIADLQARIDALTILFEDAQKRLLFEAKKKGKKKRVIKPGKFS